jgi:hypothetical protein
VQAIAGFGDSSGAVDGVAVTLFATQPRIVLDGARAQAAVADTYRQLSMFGDVFERLRADYEEMPDDSKLESAISGMLAGFDPHSSYMDSKSFRDMQVQTRGEFGGLGIEVTMEDGWRVHSRHRGLFRRCKSKKWVEPHLYWEVGVMTRTQCVIAQCVIGGSAC